LAGHAAPDYDVVLSFAGEDRRYVEQVAARLHSHGVRVFYDRYEQAQLWGKDLYEHLDEVYRNKARYCVMFISEAYRDKLWTNHERKSAQARAFREREGYILPARFDDTEIPAIRPTLGYVDLRRLTPDELADLILEKLRGEPSTRAAPPTPGFRKPRLAKRAFNPYDEALGFLARLIGELKARCEALAAEGVSASVFDRDSRKCLRVVLDGKVVYSLDVWMGGFAGDASIQFYGAPGEYRASEGSMNAWANLVWDRDAERAAVELHDLSLIGMLGEPRQYAAEELIDAVWGRICEAIEADD